MIRKKIHLGFGIKNLVPLLFLLVVSAHVNVKAAQFNSSDVPIDIVSNTTITSSLTVPSGVIIDDLNLSLSLLHTWDSDLSIYLIGPDLTRVELASNVGGSGDNFTSTLFDDEAAFSINYGSVPFTGSFCPVGLLSSFDGLNSEGTWTLEITDSYTGDEGTLLSWSLDIQHFNSISDGDFDNDDDIDGHDLGIFSQQLAADSNLVTLDNFASYFGGNQIGLPDSIRHVTEIYLAILGRAPDYDSLMYWANELYLNNYALEQMAQVFCNLPESISLTNSEFVLKLYNNVLGRDPDVASIDYWVANLGDGSYHRHEVAIVLVNAVKAESSDPVDRALFTNKVTVAIYFAMANCYDAALAISILDGISSDPVSVDNAKATIDQFVIQSGCN